jgi:hypothetical protein
VKITRLVVLALIGLSGIVVSPAQAVVADNCPVIDYSTFGFEKTPAANWKNSEPVRVITWSSNETFIATDPVSTQFSPTEQAWLQEAFDSYGEILDSVAFQKITTPSSANIVIGYTLLSKGIIPTETTGGNFGLWMFNYGSGAIQLLDAKLRPKNFTLFDSHDTFIHAVQNELGNMLGVPDVDAKGPKRALVTIYDTSKLATYGQVKINDYDAATMRQLYGESTCSSSYTAEARAANLAADKIAGEKSLTVRATTTTTVAASTPAARTSITCVKGKTIKKVTALKPVCPAGYKKK